MPEAIKQALEAYNAKYFYNLTEATLTQNVVEWLAHHYPEGDSFESWEDTVLAYLEFQGYHMDLFGVNGRTQEGYDD